MVAYHRLPTQNATAQPCSAPLFGEECCCQPIFQRLVQSQLEIGLYPISRVRASRRSRLRRTRSDAPALTTYSIECAGKSPGRSKSDEVRYLNPKMADGADQGSIDCGDLLLQAKHIHTAPGLDNLAVFKSIDRYAAKRYRRPVIRH